MSTGTSIIERAHRLIGTKAQGQTIAAERTAASLEALNAMLTRWEADGVALGFSALSAATATMPIPAEADEAVAYNLAVMIAPEYGKVAPPDVQAIAANGYNALLRDVIKPEPVRLDAPCSEVSGSYDIQTD